MPINLQVNLGTINYTDFLHVTAAKVSAPTEVVWEEWIDVPVTNYVFVIPGLDPDDYYVTFYDAPTNVALGTLVSQAFVNAKSSEYAYEIRFYEIGNLPAGASIDGTEKILTDPYLIGKTIESVFKESFRFLEPAIDFGFIGADGKISLLVPSNFQIGEKFVVTIKYAVGTVSSGSSGLYSGTLDITEATKTLIASDRNKRLRCVGSLATQVITLPSLAALAVEDGFYFDNCCSGVAIQVKILLPGANRIRYNGFWAPSDLFAEFWVSKGEHLLLKKYNDSYWEVISDYKGTAVGSRQASGFSGMPGWKVEDGSLDDGDEFGRVWWWLNNILPASHIVIDDNVIAIDFVHPPERIGQFVKHSTLKKFRWPNTQGIAEKGLANFTTYGADTYNRPVDYPGGFQDHMVLEHAHEQKMTYLFDGTQYEVGGIDDGSERPLKFKKNGIFTENFGGPEQRIKNAGVIFMRHV